MIWKYQERMASPKYIHILYQTNSRARKKTALLGRRQLYLCPETPLSLQTTVSSQRENTIIHK